MQVDDAHICTEGLFLGTEGGQAGSGQHGQDEPEEGGFQKRHAGIVPDYEIQVITCWSTVQTPFTFFSSTKYPAPASQWLMVPT